LAVLFVTEDDIQQWKESDHPEELAFLMSAAKRQRSEIRLSELSSTERAEFQPAKDAEVANWLARFNACLEAKLLRSRFCDEAGFSHGNQSRSLTEVLRILPRPKRRRLGL
jgi:hypothetical protein